MYQEKGKSSEFEIESFFPLYAISINATTKVIGVRQIAYRFLSAQHKLKICY